MSSGALPGPDLLRVIPGVLCRGARGARVELGGGVSDMSLSSLHSAFDADNSLHT